MSGVKRVNVLVLKPSVSTLESIKTLPEEFARKYNFVLKSTTFATLQDLLEFGEKILKEKDIDIVLSLYSDSRSLLKSALVQNNCFLHGPSFESVFLCVHKYYTHLMIDPDPIPYSCLDLSAIEIDRECEKALENVTLPAFVKPCTGYASKGVSVVQSKDDLKQVAKMLESKDLSTTMDSLFTNNLEVVKYPFATRSTALVQKYMDMGSTVCVNADGYVYNGEIFHWSLSDNVYSISKPQYFLATVYPTNLARHTQSRIWKLFDEVVTRLIRFGFDYSFVNVEVFVLQSGEVRLMEINPRSGASLLALSKTIYERNVFLAEIKLAEGVNPGCPKIESEKHSLLGYVRTSGSGKVEEFINYNKATSEFILDMKPDQYINGAFDSGAILARVCCSGSSRVEVLDKYWSACHQVLLKPELSVWE